MNKNDLICDCDAIHTETVELVRKRMPGEKELYDLTVFFKVLGDSTRIRIMNALNESEMCVCDLAVLLNMTKSSISHQLGKLRDVNLVRYRRDGKVVYYSMADDHIKDIYKKGFEHIREKNSAGEKIADETEI